MRHANLARVASVYVPALSALAFGYPGFVAAQDQAADGGIETVIVTARYREESLQETPIAITAVTADEIQNHAFTDSYEIANMVPNASLRPSQAAFGDTMTAYIRGIGQYDFDFAFEPGVAIYIDDVYHPFTLASQIDLLDLERVEVLRGPQGTLFGRGSIGGAIRYVTKKPQGDNTGRVQITAGNYNRIDVRADYDFSVADNLFFRVAGASRSRDGYQDVIDYACAYPSLAGDLTPQTVNRGLNCKVGTQGGQSIVGGRATMRWAPTDRFELSVTADYENDHSEAKADTLVAVDPVWPSYVNGVAYDDRFLPPNPYVSYATYDDPNTNLKVNPRSGMEKSLTSARADWSIGDNLDLVAVVAHTDITGYLATDQDASPINISTVDGLQQIYYDQVETRLSGRAFDKVDWTVGAFYYDGQSTNSQMVSIPFLSQVLDGTDPTVDPTPFVNAHNVHQNNNKSVFGHLVIDVTDRLSVNAGARYSDDEKDVNFDNTRVQNPNVVVSDTRTDWLLGVDYQLGENLMAYASASTGYRPGSYNPRPFQATQVVAVKPESSTAYEIGFKSDLLDRHLRLNVAAFVTHWDQRILPVGGDECLLLDLGPPPVYATVPVGTPDSSLDTIGNNCLDSLHLPRTYYENQPGDIQGLEVEMLYSPADRWTLNAIYGFTDWNSADINDNPNVLNDRPPFVPKDNWSTGLSYMASLPKGGTLTPRLDVYGQSEICSNTTIIGAPGLPFAGCSDGYNLVSLRMEWANPDDSWRAAIGATNLTDKQYYLNKFDLTIFSEPTVEGQPGRPREYYVTFQRNF
jgi:iron complex outermembrane receptor protein